MLCSGVMTGKDSFPGLRGYLAGRFGPEAGSASIEPLAAGGGIKKGGYGVPYRIHWEAGTGTRTLVLETVRPGRCASFRTFSCET